MRYICLVRHGETPWVKEGRLQGRTDIPLNAAGRAQMCTVGKKLCGIKWGRIITSPLQRAVESGVLIAAQQTAGPIQTVDARLVERNYGTAEGTLPRDRKFPLEPWAYPGMECRENVFSRVHEAIFSAIKEHAGENLVFVFHSGGIRTFMTEYFGVNNFSSKNAAVSLLCYNGNKLSVAFYNQTPQQLPNFKNLMEKYR